MEVVAPTMPFRASRGPFKEPASVRVPSLPKVEVAVPPKKVCVAEKIVDDACRMFTT